MQCGAIRSVKMLHGQDRNSEVAIIEFETRDEALVAQTRDQKMIDDNTIEVQFGSGSTLFVANFPPTADEEFIRDLFRDVSAVWFHAGLLLTCSSMARSLISGSLRSSTTPIGDSAMFNSSPLAMPIAPAR